MDAMRSRWSLLQRKLVIQWSRLGTGKILRQSNKFVLVQGHMKGKSKDFWLKLIGGTLGKRLEHREKRNFSLWRRISAHESEKDKFLTKTDWGSSAKKAGKSRKTQFVFVKGKMCPWRGNAKGLIKTDRRSPTKRVGNHKKNATCVYAGFWQNLVEAPLRKRLENHEKSNLRLC